MSLILNFLSLQFPKPYRYFLLIKTNGVAKRTKISQISQTPQFDFMTIDSGDIQISVCLVLDYSQKGLEGKTVILGKATIDKDEYDKVIKTEGGIILQKKFIQGKDNKEIVVGTIRLKITSTSSVKKQNSSYFEDIEQIQLKEDETTTTSVNYSEQGKRVKVGVICGTHFPFNQSYKVEIGYTSSYSSLSLKRSIQTEFVGYSTQPLWNYEGSFSLENLQGGFVTLVVKNSIESIIDKVSFPVSKLIPFHQYHFDITLKEEQDNTYPHLFVSLKLQALPLAFIEQVCELHVNKVFINPQPQPSRKFVLVFSQQQLSTIQFSPIILSKERPNQIISIETQNKQHNIPYFMSPIFITPITNQFSFEYFFLKSMFIRKRLVCTLFEFEKNSCNFRSIQKLSNNRDCINQLKSCFYNQKSELFSLEWKQANKSMRCTLEIVPSKVNLYLDQQKDYNRQGQSQVTQKWKDLSNELLLKQKLIHQMRLDIDSKVSNIETKGKKIQVLRRVEHNLLQRKKYLNYKKSKQRSIQVGDYEIQGKINMDKLKKELISLCQQTSAVESINDQMRLRLDTLDLESKQVNMKDLQARAVANSRLLLDQQEKVQHIDRLNDLIKIQHRTLLKLEKQFQKGTIDYEMNQLLNKELKKIEQDKNRLEYTMTNTTEEDNLQKILGLLSEKKKKKKPEGHIEHLKQEIEEAEEELKRKTLILAKVLRK